LERTRRFQCKVTVAANSQGEKVDVAGIAAKPAGDDQVESGYCLEMICADFLAGANLESDNSHS
jgi:hypothetical protein